MPSEDDVMLPAIYEAGRFVLCGIQRCYEADAMYNKRQIQCFLECSLYAVNTTKDHRKVTPGFQCLWWLLPPQMGSTVSISVVG